MENKDNKVKAFLNKCLSLKGLVALATIGIWVLVLQNFGIIPVNQNVYVDGGHVHVSGEVDARVRGSVEVDNTVDVNLYKINGYRNVFFNNPRIDEKDKYYVIPVTVE